MKTIKFLRDIDNKIIVDMNLKKKFEYQGFNFAIIIEPNVSHKYYTLIHYETGGKLPMFLPNNKTIKDFKEKSINSIDTLIERIGLNEFSEVLKKHKTIN